MGKRHFHWMRRALWAGLLAWSGGVSSAAEFTVKAVIREDVVYLGQVFTCYVVVDGADQAEQPEFESVDAMEVKFVGDHVSVHNGEPRQTYTFECLPRRAGDITLSGIRVTSGTEIVAADPVTVNVKAPEETDAMKLTVSLAKTEVYEGEPVVLTVLWHSELFLNGIRAVDVRLPALNDPRFKAHEPLKAIDPNDANAIGIPVENRRIIATLEEQRKGDTPISDIRFEQILVPKAAGKHTIPGAVLICSYVPPKDQKFSGFRYPSYFNNDFFDTDVKGAHQRLVVRSKPVEIEVKPLPRQGMPDRFDGIVGKIGLAAEAVPAVVAVSDPIEVKLRITGHPFPHILAPPAFRQQSALAHSFDIPGEDAEASMEDGDRVFTQTIRPLRANVSAIPGIRLTYFDPVTGSYGEASSEPIPVTVSSAAKVDAFDAVFSDGSRLRNDVSRSRAGIYHNFEGTDLLRKERPVGWLGGKIWFWLAMLLGPPAAFMALALATRRPRFAKRDPNAARARRAYAVFMRAVQSFQNAEGMAAAEAIAALEKAVNTYVADRFGLSRGASSSAEMAGLLQQRRIDAKLIRQLELFWDHASALQFSQRGSNGAGLKGLAREIPDAIMKIERTISP